MLGMTSVVVVAAAVVVIIAVKVSMAALPGEISDGRGIKWNDEPREQEEIRLLVCHVCGLVVVHAAAMDGGWAE